MNTWTKRGTMAALAMLFLIMGIVTPQKNAKAAMMYNNTTNASLSGYIDSNGVLHASLSVYGRPGITTRIEAQLYVEKQFLGIFWTRINIGYNNNTWIDSTTDYYYNNSFSTSLEGNGTYRITVIYTVSGSGGTDDSITKTCIVAY